MALAVNPCVLVHARGLDDTAPRGLSVSLFQRIANLEAEDSCALGFALRAGHAAARHGLLVAARGEWVAAAQPWAPADALVRYLAGEPSQIATLASITIPVGEIRLDAAQHAAAVRIQTILANREPLVLYIEGPALTGRRTAVALAFEGPVLGAAAVGGMAAGLPWVVIPVLADPLVFVIALAIVRLRPQGFVTVGRL